MIYCKLLLVLSLPLLLGFGVVTLIFREKAISFPERFALGWGIGLGLLGMSMFVLSLFGVRLTMTNSALPALIAAGVLACFALFRNYTLIGIRSALGAFNALIGIFTQPDRPRAVAEKLLAVLIILAVGFVFFDAMVKPIVNFDDLWRQGCIAKSIYTNGQVLTEQNIDLADAHPYLNPLSQAWIYMGIGEWNDALGKAVFALCFLGLIIVFYIGTRRYMDRCSSLLFTFLLTTFPLVVYHAGTAYSDLMQTFYYTTGIIYLFHWFKAKNNPDLYISALFLGIGVFVKQLGTPLWIIAIIVLAAYLFFENRKIFTPLLPFVLISGLVSFPWLINKNNFILLQLNALINKLFPGPADPSAISAAASQFGPPSIPGILYHLGRRMFTYADWQILWFVLLIAIVFYWQKIWKSELKYLLLAVLLYFLMMIYGFTDQYAFNFLVDGTLAHRMLMYQVPVALYLIALTISATFKLFSD